MDVSVIIVNYNTCDLTRNCLTSIYDHTKDVDFEVIVSDNGSTDGSIAMIRQNFPQVHIIENNANIGFGAANNQGLRIAKGKYLFLLNSDTLLKNNAIKLFLNYMESSSKQVACCGCILQNINGKSIHSYGDFHTMANCLDEWVFAGIIHLFNSNYQIAKYDNPKYKHGNTFQVQFITGADLFLRKSIADEYGLFDSDFFMYSEDMELQYRYHIHGFDSYIIEGPQIIHLAGSSSKKMNRLPKVEMVLNSLFLYKKKHLSKMMYLLFLCIFKLFYCPSIVLKKNSFRDKIKHIKNIIKLKP